MAHCGFAADHRATPQAVAHLGSGPDVRAVGARLQLDERRPGRRWCVHRRQGLLMYLQPEDALGLIAACAARFPGGQMMCDLPPAGLAALHRRGVRASLRYRVPPMPFTLSVSE